MSQTTGEPQTGQDLPLQHAWAIWYDRYQGPGQSANEYQQGQEKLYEFDTVIGFWKCFESKVPNSLEVKASLHLMKKGITPVWEDPENESGGFWVLRFPKDKIEAVWRDLCLAAIGENFYSVLRPGDAINGITVSIRRGDVVVQVWNKLAEEEPEQKRIINHVVNSILKDYTIGEYWYKACQGHESYDASFTPKEQKPAGNNKSSGPGSGSYRLPNRRK